MIRSSTYLNLYGDTRLYVTFSQPDTDSIGRIYIVHGYAEHHLRYAHVIEQLVLQGYEVIGFDLPGFGRSNNPRMQVSTYDEIAAAINMIRIWGEDISDYDVPEWILGHSMGGAAVLHYLLQPHAEVKGVILSAPALIIQPYTNKTIARLAARLLHFAMRLGFTTSRIIPYNYKNISRDPNVQEFFYKDPFCDPHKVPIQTAYTLLDSGQRILEQSNQIADPILLLHGTSDKMINILGSEKLAKDAQQVKEFIQYEGLHHELLQEPEQNTVINDILTWLKNPEVLGK